MSQERHIAEYLALRGSKIHPAFVMGTESTVKEFALTFFATCSNEQLQNLWLITDEKLSSIHQQTDNSERINISEDIPVLFFKKREDEIPSLISKSEMKDFKFNQNKTWTSKFSFLEKNNTRYFPLMITFS